MENIFIQIGAALWFGILTSISPCPLATNIAAVSYISNNIVNSKNYWLSGLIYSFGRILSYTIIGILIVTGLTQITNISFTLQEWINKILGPVLILTGMVLLEIIQFKQSGSNFFQKLQDKIKNMGVIGALILGIIFALAFCPVSAALFFGSLIPIAVQNNSPVLMPVIYGFGTALPVIVLSIILSVSIQAISKVYKNLEKIELWARRITAVIFIIIGIYLSLKYIFHIIP